MLLIGAQAKRVYDHTQTNVGTPGSSGTPSTSNVGTDELPAGNGYFSGDQQLVQTSPSLSGTAGRFGLADCVLITTTARSASG
jgi:hypothetical protein